MDSNSEVTKQKDPMLHDAYVIDLILANNEQEKQFGDKLLLETSPAIAICYDLQT